MSTACARTEYDDSAGAYQRWTTTVLGPSIAYLNVLFPISSDFCSTLLLRWRIWNTSYLYKSLQYGEDAIYRAYVFLRGVEYCVGLPGRKYLGPTARQMVFLLIFFVTNSLTLFALSILFVRNVWCLGANVTTIEGWEIERHQTLVRRARKLGGYLNGPDGQKIRLVKQEFPYDIGIYKNIRQGMGSSPWLWLWPFTSSPSHASGLDFETNGFEGRDLRHTFDLTDLNRLDPSLQWPPPDPDRMPRSDRQVSQAWASFVENEAVSDRDRLYQFYQRQGQDLKRLSRKGTPSRCSTIHEHQNIGQIDIDNGAIESIGSPSKAEDVEVWRDSEGDRLDDFGVDEDIECFNEDEIPIAELLRRRRALSHHDD